MLNSSARRISSLVQGDERERRLNARPTSGINLAGSSSCRRVRQSTGVPSAEVSARRCRWPPGHSPQLRAPPSPYHNLPYCAESAAKSVRWRTLAPADVCAYPQSVKAARRTRYVRERTETFDATPIMIKSWTSARRAHEPPCTCRAFHPLRCIQCASADLRAIPRALGRYHCVLDRCLLIGSVGIQRPEALICRVCPSGGDPSGRAV